MRKHKFKESKYQRSVSFGVKTLSQLEEIRVKTESALTDNEIIAAAIADYHRKATEVPLILCPVCSAKYSAVVGHCPRCAASAGGEAESVLDEIVADKVAE